MPADPSSVYDNFPGTERVQEWGQKKEKQP